jgi:hypothetical protein
MNIVLDKRELEQECFMHLNALIINKTIMQICDLKIKYKVIFQLFKFIQKN